MPKLSSYLMRFFLLLITCVVLVTTAMFALSSYLSQGSYNTLYSTELETALNMGKTLFLAECMGGMTEDELQSELNPTLNPGGTFVVVLDKNMRVIAYTEAAVPYLANSGVQSFIQSLESHKATLTTGRTSLGTAFLLGTAIGEENNVLGYVISGKPLSVYTGATSNYRYNLMMWILPIFLLFLVMSTFAARRVARPAQLLMKAASDLSEGKLTQVDVDELPGEMGDIGRAFNHMSGTLNRTFTALVYEKETMTLILEGLTEGILALDSKGRVLHENSAALSLLGGNRSDAYKRVKDALFASMQPSAPEEANTDKLQVEDKTLLYVISQLPAKSNNHRGAVALIRDITEQERLERTRYDYVANISHELRTPLASMRGIAEGLRDGLVTEESDKQRYYHMIVQEVLRLSRLVNDLLELSSLQSNPTAFELEKVDATELMYEMQDRNRSVFDEAHLTLELQVPDEPLPEIITNEDRLTEVLTIFLDNARKYTPEGGKVILRGKETAKGVLFEVQDTGIGMDAETMRLAFDRFHQAEKSHSGKGSGLGLSIAREIMNKMNVEITVQSELGKGSTFGFVIPVYQKNKDGENAG